MIYSTAYVLGVQSGFDVRNGYHNKLSASLLSHLIQKKKKVFLVVRTFKVYPLNNFHIFSSVYYINHVVHYIPRAYLSCT